MREISYAEALYEAFREEMTRDPTIFIIGLDLRLENWVTKKLWEEFGDSRVINAPISEASYTLAGLGAAMAGMRPVVDCKRIDFLMSAYDAVLNQISQRRQMSGGQFPTAVVLNTGSGAGGGQSPHHSQSLEALFLHCPGLVVVAPATPYDVKGLMKTALRGPDPVIFCHHRAVTGGLGLATGAPGVVGGHVPEEEYFVPFGEAVVRRRGTDVTVVAGPGMLYKALEAATQLEGEGISTEVIDPRTLHPLDTRTLIESVAKTKRLVVAEEGRKTAGLGAEIISVVAEEVGGHLRVRRVAASDVPIPFGIAGESAVLPQVADLARAVQEVAL